ncbi:hypothetical protein A5N17_09720 [Arthrobacter sp. D2]|nr:hypothetical protein [Arthrobacter sp. M5]NKR14803.1 hypothetical protein [Arthrobacter sp. M6]OEH62358.1 hypothetical protein A5N13_01480 [Arthrobacter sp. D4]OEH62929.1 hypothetical protein A5N17_09720 [Arthrobacter sp. D2]
MTSADDDAHGRAGNTVVDNDGAKADDGVPKKLKAPATRRRVSGVELEARFESWRSERHCELQARTPQESARRTRLVLSGVMGVAILGLAAAAGVTGRGFEVEHAANADRIASLQVQVEDARSTPVATDLSGKMMRLTEAAAKDARKVAEAQQGFAQLHHEAATQPNAGNGTPNAAMLQIAEHRRTLAPLFSLRSFLADEKGAYSWTSVTPFDPSTQIDPRFPWYVRYEGVKASSPDVYAWSVESVMPDLAVQDATGTTRTARVIWLCRDTASGQVLAWANAAYSYDGRTGTFDDLKVVVTAAGAEHQQGASATGNGSGEG